MQMLADSLSDVVLAIFLCQEPTKPSRYRDPDEVLSVAVVHKISTHGITKPADAKWNLHNTAAWLWRALPLDASGHPSLDVRVG